MRHVPGKGVALFVFILTVLLSSTAAGSRPAVAIIGSHPGTGSVLAPGQPLYLRISYESPRPLHFQARVPAADSRLLMTNPSPLYPVGRGEALVWVAFRGEQFVDELVLEVADENRQALQQLRVPVRTRWSASNPDPAPPMPRWAVELNRLQQERVQASFRQDADTGGDGWIQLMALSLPLYLLLQFIAWRRWQGGWRRAGLAPLWVAVPLLAYTLFALFSGSGLWPVMLLFFSPLLFCYLFILFLARRFGMGRS